MGLKTENYIVHSLGITLESAYAKIGKLEVDKNGNAKAVVEIQQSRDLAETLEPLEMHEVNFIADKTKPIYEQAYIAAKTALFHNWEDDIQLGGE